MRHASNESGSWSPGASFRTYSDGQVALVAAPASVHAGNAQQFWAALAEAAASHKLTVVDLSATRLTDHRALIPLLMALRVTDTAGSRLRVVAGDDVRRQLDAARLGRLIPVFGNLSRALHPAAWPTSARPARQPGGYPKPRTASPAAGQQQSAEDSSSGQVRAGRRVSAAPARTRVTVHWHAGPARPLRKR